MIFYCQIGRRSRELDDLACIEGRKAFSLQDGYIGYIRFRAANETDLEERRLAELKKENPYIEANIFNSMENVDLGAVIGYKKNSIKHSFLEEY